MLEGLGLTNDSDLGGAPLGCPAIAAHGVAVVDYRVHGDQRCQYEAHGADDVAAHSLGDQGCASGHVELEHCSGNPLLDATLADAKVPGDLLRGHALGNVENAFKLTGRQAPAQVAFPLANGDGVDDLLSGGCIGEPIPPVSLNMLM